MLPQVKLSKKTLALCLGLVLLIPTSLLIKSKAQGNKLILEVTPSQDQFRVVKAILDEQRQANERYNNQLEGAVRGILAATIDPNTKKPMESKDGWKLTSVDNSPQPNLDKGFKFVRPDPDAKPAAPLTAPPPAPEGSK